MTLIELISQHATDTGTLIPASCRHFAETETRRRQALKFDSSGNISVPGTWYLVTGNWYWYYRNLNGFTLAN